MKKSLLLIGVMAVFFLVVHSAFFFTATLSGNGLDNRFESNSLGFGENVNSVQESAVLASLGNTSITDYVLVYTNLTAHLWTFVYSNNSLLNVKKDVYIKAYRDVEVSGRIVRAGSTLILRDFGTSLIITSANDDVVFVVRLRSIQSVRDIEEIRDDFVVSEVDMNLALSWAVQTVLAGIPAMAIVGRWRMSKI